MSETDYAVTVVLDREYGERLLTIPADVPVWIVDTPLNRAAAEKAWAQRGTASHLHGVTTFKFSETESAEETLILELGTIDLHHGVYSAQYPYTAIDVIWRSCQRTYQDGDTNVRINEFHSTAVGFRAVRPLPTNEPE